MKTQNLLEKIISNFLHEKYLDEMDVAGNCKYFYRILESKFAKALEDIRSLNHYINQKKIKKSKSGKKK